MTLLEFELLGEKTPKLFSGVPSGSFHQEKLLPKIDISEDEKNIYFEAELPGINKEDVNISLENNVLTIKGEKKIGNLQHDKSFIINERIYGTFSRTFTLQEEINPDSAKAEFSNGILTIEIEKRIDKPSKERKIEVK